MHLYFFDGNVNLTESVGNNKRKKSAWKKDWKETWKVVRVHSAEKSDILFNLKFYFVCKKCSRRKGY